MFGDVVVVTYMGPDHPATPSQLPVLRIHEVYKLFIV